MSLISPICADVNSSITDEFDEVISVDSLEYDGNLIVAIRTIPFFTRSSRTNFENRVIQYISEKFSISLDKIFITFDIETLYKITHINTRDDIIEIYNEICKESKK